MCEILAVNSDRPIEMSSLFPIAQKMEYFGIAGLGWGVAWLAGERVERYRQLGRLEDDAAGKEQLSSVKSTHFLFHFRRPTRLSTSQLPDTQPFMSEGGSFAFCHNGSFEREAVFRSDYASRLAGKADSEVGFLMLTDELRRGVPADKAMQSIHAKLRGNSNLGFLSSTGDLIVYSAYPANRLWHFRQEGADIAATEVHSQDGAMFEMIFQRATDKKPVDGIAWIRADSSDKAKTSGAVVT